MKKVKFSDIPIGGKFNKCTSCNSEAFSEMICVKVDGERYSLLNQERLWKSDKNKEYILIK